MNLEDRIHRVWDAIDAEVRAHYDAQIPMRYGTLIGWQIGGPDPLDAIAIYWHPDGHWHYVGFGLAEHADKEGTRPEVSGWGFELTFRLRAPAEIRALDGAIDPALPGVLEAAARAPRWPIVLLNDIARHVFETRRPLGHGHFIERPGSPFGAFWGVMADPVLRPVETINGRFAWMQLVALTEPQFRRLQGDDYEAFLVEYRTENPLLVSSVVGPEN